MIVVDENIQDDLVIRTIASWYPGQVISVTALRLQTLIKDDGIAMLLHQASEPTFVTTNVDDSGRNSLLIDGIVLSVSY